MKRSVIASTILLLAAVTATAMPISTGYLMVSGGPESSSAGFGGMNPVLIIPVPDYVPGAALSWDPTEIPGFDDVWVGDSHVWFLGGALLPPGTPPGVDPFLFLSQDGQQELLREEKLRFLDALNLLAGEEPDDEESRQPFAMDWETYEGFVFGATGIDFLTGPSVRFNGEFGPIQLSTAVGSPSTEVDIIEHSPPNGLPIRLFSQVGAGGLVTGMSAVVLPEPGSISLFVAGIGGLALALVRRRRRR